MSFFLLYKNSYPSVKISNFWVLLALRDSIKEKRMREKKQKGQMNIHPWCHFADELHAMRCVSSVLPFVFTPVPWRRAPGEPEPCLPRRGSRQEGARAEQPHTVCRPRVTWCHGPWGPRKGPVGRRASWCRKSCLPSRHFSNWSDSILVWELQWLFFFLTYFKYLYFLSLSEGRLYQQAL